MSNPNPIANPDLRALLNAHADEIFASLNCHQIGTIIDYTEATGTATVQINAKRIVYNTPQTGDSVLQQTPTLVDYPPLKDVPVMFPSGGGAFLYFPVKKGDQCLLLFNDRDIDSWFEAGGTNPPPSARMHSLSDAIAIVGISNKVTPPPVGGGDVVLIYSGGTISINLAGSPTLHSAGGCNIQLGTKVQFQNGSTSLKAALDSLLDTLAAWVNTGGSTPNPATVTALAAVKTTIDSLLT